MSATPAITMTEWNVSKFRTLPITQAALDLINRSETLKADIRNYEVSLTTANAEKNINPNAGSYSIPVPATGTTSAEKGQLSIGANRLSS